MASSGQQSDRRPSDRMRDRHDRDQQYKSRHSYEYKPTNYTRRSPTGGESSGTRNRRESTYDRQRDRREHTQDTRRSTQSSSAATYGSRYTSSEHGRRDTRDSDTRHSYQPLSNRDHHARVNDSPNARRPFQHSSKSRGDSDAPQSGPKELGWYVSSVVDKLTPTVCRAFIGSMDNPCKNHATFVIHNDTIKDAQPIALCDGCMKGMDDRVGYRIRAKPIRR